MRRNKKKDEFYRHEASCPESPGCIIINGKKYCQVGLIKSCMFQENNPEATEHKFKVLCGCNRDCSKNKLLRRPLPNENKTQNL